MYNKEQSFSRNIARYIGRLEKMRRQFLNSRLHPYKLKGSMFLMLLYLDKYPGSSQDALVEFIGIDKSGIARKCRQMDDFGYITREEDNANRRQYSLFLTDAGRALLPVIRTLLEEWSNRITAGMDIGEKKELIRLLEIMANNAIAEH
ncbi:MAG TPA: MarR family winged helix-turn-helix transcriptional regulator [Candidatus Limiplasma sp.]|nr:MarR family winged helix-turn-helix transcriptional regulator [Candidatus Limiplasma sp.]